MLLSLLVSTISASQILVMNDIHLDINATAYQIPLTGEVCNLALWDIMVQKAYDFVKETGEMPTAILIPGDFNEHDLPDDNLYSGEPNVHWPQMVDTFRTVMQTLAAAFPGVPIYPAIGNNDCYYHNNAPFVNYADDYYSEL